MYVFKVEFTLYVLVLLFELEYTVVFNVLYERLDVDLTSSCKDSR